MKVTLKEKLVLLSKVAKEQKYAQEYLGLLARRGDLGSIRIGKRWYTTMDWFEEFLEDTKKRKEEMKAQDSLQAAAEKEIIQRQALNSQDEDRAGIEISEMDTQQGLTSSVEFHEESSTDGKIFSEEKKRVLSTPRHFVRPVVANGRKNEPAVPVRNFERGMGVGKLAEPVQRKKKTIFMEGAIGYAAKKSFTTSDKYDSRAALQVRRIQKLSQSGEGKKSEVLLRSRREWPGAYQEVVYRKNNYNFSPSFYVAGNILSALFPKLAISGMGMLLLVVLLGSAFIYRKDISLLAGMQKGIVAGAEDTKLTGISSVKTSSLSYIEARRGEIKENFSFSRLALKSALETEGSEDPVAAPR